MKTEHISRTDFFELLWKNKEMDELWVESRYSLSSDFNSGKVQRLWKKISSLNEWLLETEQKIAIRPHNVHYSPSPKKNPSGYKKDVAGLICFWTDIDGIDINTFLKEMLPHLKKTGVSPTVSSSSGWGTHLYWIFDSIMQFESTNKEQLRYIERYNKFLAWLVGGDVQASDAAHLMRMPWSFNCKTHPFKEAQAFLTGNSYRYDNIISSINEISESFMENGDDTVKIKLQSIMGGKTNSIYNNRNVSSFSENNNLENMNEKELSSKKIEEILSVYGKLNECRILATALKNPSLLSLKGWFSLGCALNKTFGDRNGWLLFKRISSLDSERFNEEKCFQTWLNIVEKKYIPGSCKNGVVPEGESCSLLVNGKCGNIMKQIMKGKRLIQ